LSNQNQDQSFAPGTVIGGSYRILRLLGEGGMGAIYEVEHVHFTKRFALKLLTKASVTETDWLRFKQEAKALSKLPHENIVQVNDLGIDKGVPFYVMELVKGESLRKKLKDRGKLSMKESLTIFEKLASTLAYVHENGIIHRDIKPDNIMIISQTKQTEGGTKQELGIKLVDFGISKLSNPDTPGLTRAGEVFGSPIYMSPEQCIGQKVDGRSDIYAMGCALFECLTSKSPFLGKNAAETITKKLSDPPPLLSDVTPDQNFPLELEDLVDSMLAREPERRPESAARVAAKLRKIRKALLDGPPQSTARRPVRTSQHQQPNTQNRPRFDAEVTQTNLNSGLGLKVAIAAIGLVVLTLLIVFVALLAPLSSKNDSARSHVEEENSVKLPEKEKRNLIIYGGHPEYATPPDWNFLEKAPFLSRRKPSGEIILNFPGKSTIGKFRFTILGARTSEKLEARGSQTLPKDTWVFFQPRDDLFNRPYLLRKLEDGSISDLDCESEMFNCDCLDELTHLKSLNSLHINHTNINNQCLSKLNSLKSLEKVELDIPTLEDDEIAKLKILNNLRYINIAGSKSRSKTIAALAGSKKLRTLVLDGCPLTDQDFLNISKIVSLERLDIAGSAPSNQNLLALQKLSNLKGIDIRDCTIPEETFKLFKAFPSLQGIRSDLSGEALNNMRQYLAPVQIDDDKSKFRNRLFY